MSPDVKDLVQTSNNVARVQLNNGAYTVMCLTRGSVESEKMDEADTIRAAFELIGAEVEFTGGYPGWTPASRREDREADVRTCTRSSSRKKPKVLALPRRPGMRHHRPQLPRHGDDQLRPYHPWCALPGREGEHPFGREVLEVPAGGTGEAIGPQARLPDEQPRQEGQQEGRIFNTT
jgi:hypothetical protein